MMDSTSRVSSPRTDEIGIRDLIREITRNKWRIACVVALAMIAAAVAAALWTPQYKATAVVSPVASTPGNGSGGGAGGALSQLGGLASLAGLGVSGDSRKNESLAVLKSEELTERYIQQNGLLPVLYSRLWDPVRGVWTENKPGKVPTLWTANRMFAGSIREITMDPKTSLVTLTINWKDPKAAAKWANGLVAMANDYLKSKALAESERNMAFLNAEAAKTDVVPIRQAIYSLLQNEINKEMLARGSDEYAFKILDPAIAPERPVSPRAAIWIAGALFGSLALCVLALYARLAWLQE